MKKHMYEIAIYTKGSEVIIEQPFPFENPDTINLTVEQIEPLIQWLLEAKEELKSDAENQVD